MYKLDLNLIELDTKLIETKLLMLSHDNKDYFEKNYLQKSKNKHIYSIFSMIFFFGLHHFYIKEYFRGISVLFFLFLSILFLFLEYHIVSVFFIVLIVFFEVSDIFDSEKIVKNYNNKLALKLLTQLDNN